MNSLLHVQRMLRPVIAGGLACYLLRLVEKERVQREMCEVI
jgi:hypothetical protein